MHSELFTPANGDREDAPNIAIIMTDRAGSLQSAVHQSNVARSKGIHVTVIGIGGQVRYLYIFKNNLGMMKTFLNICTGRNIDYCI